jgi:hypothetical protein
LKGAILEAAMPRKSQSGQKDTRKSGQPQQGNLGQKEAQQQQEREAESRQMGDKPRESERPDKQQSD